MTNDNYISAKSLDFKSRKRILDFQIKMLDSVSTQVLQKADTKTRFNVQEILGGVGRWGNTWERELGV